jgi:membrane protease YdiL (CAAX protease family)
MEPIERSRAGFNPILLLAGVIFIFALSIVLSPLEELMPVDNSMYDDSVWTLIMVVVIAPIFEEILFRGKLYNMLRISASPLTSVVLASLLFGAVHLEPIIAISGLPWGLLLGFVYLRSRSIIAPIILHMFNNALAYATIVLSYDDKSIVELIDGERYFLLIYIVSALIVVIAMIRFVTFIVKQGRQNNNVVVVDTASQESVESGSVDSGDEA